VVAVVMHDASSHVLSIVHWTQMVLARMFDEKQQQWMRGLSGFIMNQNNAAAVCFRSPT
jgi:hypothetical protein